MRCTPVIRAIEIGDAGDHRRPGLGRQVLVRPIVAARMEAQAAAMVHMRQFRDAANMSRRRVPSIGCDIANSRRAASCDPAGAGGRMERSGASCRLRARQLQKASRLLGDLAEIAQAQAFDG